MQHLDLSTAEDKILADIRRYVAEVEGIVRSPIETVGHGVRMLVALRKTSYEISIKFSTSMQRSAPSNG